MFDMLSGQYKNLASKGRYGDTMLAHINPQEAALLQSMGGAGTINPKTGLPEFYGTSQIKYLQENPYASLEPLPTLGQALAPESLANLATQLNTTTVPAQDYRGMPGIIPASQQISSKYAQYADRSPALGMGGGRQVEGYTIPTDKTFQNIPLVAQYDAQGNFKQLTLERGQYLTPDPSQPNIQSVPRIDAKGQVIDFGIVDVNDLEDGGFTSMIRELGTELGPIILAAVGSQLATNLGFGSAAGAGGATAADIAASNALAQANLTGYAGTAFSAIPTGTGLLSTAVGTGNAPLGPYVSQAAGAYSGSTAAANAAAAGSLTGIQAASAAQNALTAEALGRTGITYGGNVTPADIPTTTPNPSAPDGPMGPPTPTNIQPYVPPTAPEFVGPPTPTNIQPYTPPVTPEFVGPPTPTNIQPYIPTPTPGLLDKIISNPSIAGTVLGTVVTALDDKNKPTSTTTTSSIDPDIKAKYLAYLKDAETASAGLMERKFAPTDQMYTTAETQLNTLGLTPFGATDIARFFNPYEDQVVKNTLADIESARKIQEQANRDRALQARAFGGSRQAVVTGMTNEAALRQAANTAAQLRSAGYTQAANLGLTARPLDFAGLQTSLGLGTARTTLAQQKLDAARNLALEKLSITGGALGLQPANTGGTTSQPLYSNTAGNLLSGGLTGAYIGSLLQPKIT